MSEWPTSRFFAVLNHCGWQRAHLPWVQSLTIDHVVDAAGSANDDVLAGLEHADILLHVRPADAGVAKNAHVITQGEDHLIGAMIEAIIPFPLGPYARYPAGKILNHLTF